MALGGGEIAAWIRWPGIVVTNRRSWIVGLGNRVPEGHDCTHVFAVEGENTWLYCLELRETVLIVEACFKGDPVFTPQLHAGGNEEFAVSLGPGAVDPDQDLIVPCGVL